MVNTIADAQHKSPHRTREAQPMLTRKTAKLNVSQLEDRLVPAILDLTATGVEFGQVGAAVFARFTGTSGVPTDTFLSIDSHGTEQGYNTDNVSQFDEVVSHSIRVSDLPVVTFEGVPYREVLLDVLEGKSKRATPISLDDVAVFVGPVGNLTTFASIIGGGVSLNGFPAKYHLDSVNGTDNGVLIDSKLAGTTGGDMLFYVPDSILTLDGTPDPYFYLYSRFGIDGAAEGKAESWMRGIGGSVSPSTAATIDASGLIVPPPPPPVAPVSQPVEETSDDSGTVWL
jgi:hypothetical protein